MAPIAPARTEPPGITIADLVVLVLGVALAVALPWPPAFSPSRLRWSLQLTAVAMGRACVALVPVVLVLPH
jgi:hypothetical protein